MIGRIGRLSACCLLLLGVAEARAVPVSFEFDAGVYSVAWSNGGVPVPAPFDDSSFVLGASVSGSFTIETDTLGTPVYSRRDGVYIEDGTYYSNPVTQLAFSIGDQQFSFITSRPPVGSRIVESGVTVIDLPAPDDDPTTNYDSYGFDIYFGPGLFSGPYSQLSASLSLVRMERDLSLISSRDILANLAPSENWDAFLTLYDEADLSRNYQIHAPLTSLAQITSVPEPGTTALLALGLALAATGIGTRQRIAG